MAGYTKFTNVEVTGDLKAKTVGIDAAKDWEACDKVESSFDKDKFNLVVDAVNDIMTALGMPASS